MRRVVGSSSIIVMFLIFSIVLSKFKSDFDLWSENEVLSFDTDRLVSPLIRIGSSLKLFYSSIRLFIFKRDLISESKSLSRIFVFPSKADPHSRSV